MSGALLNRVTLQYPFSATVLKVEKNPLYKLISQEINKTDKESVFLYCVHVSIT